MSSGTISVANHVYSQKHGTRHARKRNQLCDVVSTLTLLETNTIYFGAWINTTYIPYVNHAAKREAAIPKG